LGTKQIGSKRAGSRYEKAIEFFIRRRSSQIDGRANSKDIEREEFIKYCKDNGLWKGKAVLDRCSKQFCFLKCDALVVQITKWETPTKIEQKKLKKSWIIIPFCSSYFSG
jgi:hypothetical protein